MLPPVPDGFFSLQSIAQKSRLVNHQT